MIRISGDSGSGSTTVIIQASSTTAMSAPADIRCVPITPVAMDAVAQVGFEAFRDFNLSVGQEPEFPGPQVYRLIIDERLILPDTFTSMAITGPSDTVVGSVAMDTCDGVCGVGPISVSTSAHSRGIGRTLMQNCIDEGQRLGKPVRLVNVVYNIGAFSLYAKLGFQPREYLVHMTGPLHSQYHTALATELKQRQWSIRAMTVDDVELCDQLFIRTNNASRANDIRRAAQSPTPSAFVLLDSQSNVIGYCGGSDFPSHWVAVDEGAMLQLYHFASSQSYEEGTHINVIGSRYPSLLRRMLQYGAKATRQLCLMSIGDYAPPQQHVYCPSVIW